MIKIICVGKLKESYITLMVNDYLNRLNKYHKTNIIEVKDSDKYKEALEIKKYINNKDYNVVLSIDGEKLDSITLSKKIDNWLMNYGNITFIIGGSDGLDDSINAIADYKLSFSDFTFPHGLFRGILLEQLYRSFKIINNETYHK